MSQSPLLTQPVDISWDDLKRASALHRAEQMAHAIPSSAPEPSPRVLPKEKPIFTNPILARREEALLDKDAIMQKVMPVAKAKLESELDFMLELTLKNAQTKLRKEMKAVIEAIVREAVDEALASGRHRQ